ncbi:MAG: YdbL family protein [Sphingobium sp.]
MTRKTLFAAAALGVLAAGFAFSAPVRAQVSQALAAGSVGEQADGYLGIAGTVSDAIRAEVDAINIKRRAAYTDLAAKRGVTVADAAAATGCQTLATRVKTGQVYRIGSGPWQTKGAGPISLPDYCTTAG